MNAPDHEGDPAPKTIADTGAAQVDLDRRRRCGFPEVIFAEGKTVEAMAGIFRSLLADKQDVFATRLCAEHAAELQETFPDARYNATARTLRIRPKGIKPSALVGKVAVVTAGTSDLPVAEEAIETLDWCSVKTVLVQDVGVAGPHRIVANLPILEGSDVVIVIAGMEGALPSVVGGHVACPVIAVPTSVGYGASFQGIAALLGMLNSCASNVTVVNIDAGFKAGYVAALIAKNANR